MRLLALLTVILALSGCLLGTYARGASGQPLALAAETLDGEPVEINGPGPARVVDVWATWCSPCRAAAPRVRAVLTRHPNVSGISLSVDDDVGDLRRFLGHHAVAGTPLHFPGGLTRAGKAGIDRIPLFLVVDQQGRISGVIEGLGPGFEMRLERMVAAVAGP